MFNQSIEERENNQNVFQPLTRRYKISHWYWEFLLFLKRFIIALLTSLNYLLPDIMHIILMSVIICFIILTVYYRPFIYNRANIFQVICLFALISVIISLQYLSENNYTFVVFYITFWTLTPFIAIIILLILIVKTNYTFQTTKDDNIFLNKYSNKIKQIKTRMNRLETHGTTNTELQLSEMVKNKVEKDLSTKNIAKKSIGKLEKKNESISYDHESKQDIDASNKLPNEIKSENIENSSQNENQCDENEEMKIEAIANNNKERNVETTEMVNIAKDTIEQSESSDLPSKLSNAENDDSDESAKNKNDCI